MHGTVTRLRLDKGYGFIQPNDGSPDVFFHVRDLSDQELFDEQLQSRDVEYSLGRGRDGKPRAFNIRPAR